jgi:ATP-dependent 26S proteasome regulatory subunit
MAHHIPPLINGGATGIYMYIYHVNHFCGQSYVGAELRSVCTEAGMFAIRARRKSVSEKDFLESVNKVIKGYQKFSSTPKYMVYN